MTWTKVQSDRRMALQPAQKELAERIGKKRTCLILCLLCMAGMTAWANQITYTATEALTLNADPFDLPIQSHAFANGKGTITFAGDVTTIREYAFMGRENMTSIALPNTITRIEQYAFYACRGLTSFVIPNSVKTIGNTVFNACIDLTSVTFKGAACQNAISTDAFTNVGVIVTTTLNLPDDWNYANAPDGSSSAWHGGKFNSNLYSTEEATDK